MLVVQNYVVHLKDGVWQVRLGGRHLGSQPTQLGALHLAEALANAGAARGERATVVVTDYDGSRIEFPPVEPRRGSV